MCLTGGFTQKPKALHHLTLVPAPAHLVSLGGPKISFGDERRAPLSGSRHSLLAHENEFKEAGKRLLAPH